VFPCIDANVDANWGSDQWVEGGYSILEQPASVMWSASDQAGAERLVESAGTLNCNRGQRGGWVAPVGVPDPAYALSAGNQSKGGVFGSGRDSQDTFVVDSNGVRQEADARAVAFKPSHFTRGKDGKPDEVTPPLSADADKGDQDTLVCATENLAAAVAFDTTQVTSPKNYSNPKLGDPCHPLAAGAHVPAIAFKESQSGCRVSDVHATIDANKGSRRQEGVVEFAATPIQEVGKRTGKSTDDPRAGIGIGNTGDPMFTMQANAQHGIFAFAQNQLGEVRENADVMGTVNTNQNASGRNTPMVHSAMQVRRLTPKECEYLQGFPADHTNVTYRNKPAADGPRYRALGNSMAVPCMVWLGHRIHQATKGDTT
jgi:hypothetical protein